MLIYLLLALHLFIGLTTGIIAPECRDKDANCRDWVNANFTQCLEPGFIQTSCPRACLICNMMQVVHHLLLKPIQFLIGIWRSEHDGKAFFPTIPRFTYGEQLEIKLPGLQFNSRPALNYSAFAWAMNGGRLSNEELHSELGYLSMADNGRFALSTVMSNGFATVEEGELHNQTLRFRLLQIGRITFGHDLPVKDLIREWRLVTPTILEARLAMQTIDHHMLDHTSIVYRKIFP
ncbi:hypothetical protein M3Y97_00285600 [Aphelenchoides bicaudatus]|nr:hypothetical protein M3Y97_00285600 [Aphelenchoides bicaudatus]